MTVLVSHNIIVNSVRPNNELQYNISTDSFCLEDPTTNFHLMITCSLTQVPLPELPNFQWMVALNNTVLSPEDVYLYGLSAHQDNDTLTLNGSLIVGLNNNSTLDVICFTVNSFGNDTESTSISLCGKHYGSCTTL